MIRAPGDRSKTRPVIFMITKTVATSAARRGQQIMPDAPAEGDSGDQHDHARAITNLS